MPRIVIENGPDRGESTVISPGTEFIAGRDPSAQIPIRDEMASRKHFLIEYSDGRFLLRDLGSKNGMSLNGSRLEGSATLSANDRIQVGETLLTFVGDDPHPLLGKELSGYRIEDRIGRGGMGTVYRALQLSLDRTVAMKILAPHLVENQSFINLFIREARAAGALSHPNLVQVYDVGVEEDIYFYSMEYIPHGSVEELLNEEKQLSVHRTLEIVRDAALGLQYAELKGLVHRDIKPGNLMVGSENIIKIGDLGIARFGEEEGVVSQKDGVSGSPHYIAPEQARGQDIDHRADLYALGVSFYQMLCGKTPYRGSTPREVILGHIKREPTPLAEQAPEVPAPVVELVEAMMEKDRDQRIPSATAVLERLEPLLRRYRDGGDTSEFSGEGSKGALKWILGLLALGLVTVGITLAVLHRNNSIAEERERIDGWTQRIVAAEALKSAEETAELSTALDRLHEIDDLPPELAERRTALSTWLEERTREEEIAARERFTEQAFRTLEEKVKTLDGASALAAWETFIADHSGSDWASRARQRRDTLSREINEKADRERTASLRIRSSIEAARDLARDGDYPRALERLGSVSFPGTEADNARLAEMRRVEEEAREAWDRHARRVRSQIEEKRFNQARRTLQRFKTPESLALAARALEKEIEAAEQLAGEDTGGPLGDPLALALGPILEAWGTADSPREIDGQIGDLRFTLRLDEEEKVLLNSARELMGELPDFLDTVGKSLDPNAGELDLTLEGETKTYLVSKFEASRIYAKEPEARATTVLNWEDLSPESRLRVLRSSSGFVPDHYALYGWFAYANGDRDLAEQIWGVAPEGSKAQIAGLRSLADRIDATND